MWTSEKWHPVTYAVKPYALTGTLEVKTTGKLLLLEEEVEVWVALAVLERLLALALAVVLALALALLHEALATLAASVV